MATEAPPPYSEVVAGLQKDLGEKPSTEKIVQIVSQLPDHKLEALLNAPPTLDPAYVAEFRIAVAQKVADQEKNLKIAGNDAAKACAEIDEMFTNLSSELHKVDAANTPPKEGAFGPRLLAVQNRYRTAIHNSAELAVRSAVYAGRFDDVIIAMCKDPEFTREERLEKVKEYIKDSESLQASSKAVQAEFTAVRDDLNRFIKTFEGWADAQQKDLSDKVAKLQQEAKQLWEDVESMVGHRKRAGWLAVGCIFGTLLSMMCGPIGLLVGAGFFLVGIGSYISFEIFAAAVERREEKWRAKLKEIREAEKDLNDLQKKKTALLALGAASLETFDRNVQILNSTWECVYEDAKKIQEYLEKGAKDIDRPEYLMLDFGNAAGIYKVMSSYLHQYADSIATGTIPKHDPPAYTEKQ